MRNYIFRRVLMFVPTVLLLSIIVFFIIQLPPGDYITSYVSRMSAEGEIFTSEDIAKLRQQYGLDKPWYVQYFMWMKNIITKGDFGYSFAYNRPVWTVIMSRLPLTVIITLIIMIFTYLVSLPIGIYSALHQYSVGDFVFTAFGFLGIATPNFLLAIILMYISFKWTGDPLLGLFSEEILREGLNINNLGSFLRHMIIPIIVIGTDSTCGVIRTVRARCLMKLQGSMC
ncbi:ABC transporter permease [Thermoclostridium stercorarium]|uniref:ABC transporter permease n=1 Tax=Thermoclostridium stercorarium TaxID=1510 RepID=UPI0020926053|nr:ABC transporter permease [Thermoclostridium stercorarium]